MKKYYITCFICLIAFSFTARADTRRIPWGVYHETPGEIPEGNRTDEYLLQYGAYYHGFTYGEKILYLTFDAGYEDGNTEKILDCLKDRGVHAAFFLTGHYVKANPDIVRRMVNEGHLVCNHTMTHPNTYKLNSSDFKAELKQVEDLYRDITGTEMPKYFRPPLGAFSEKNLKDAQAIGYKTIFWGIAYRDWEKKQPSRKEAYAQIIPNLHPGAIILLHTTSTTNAAMMPTLIDACHNKGYTFRSLDDFLSHGVITYPASNYVPHD